MAALAFFNANDSWFLFAKMMATTNIAWPNANKKLTATLFDRYINGQLIRMASLFLTQYNNLASCVIKALTMIYFTLYHYRC